ncbi:TonB-dependent siderophore receptor [Sphingobium sp. GW456-12-10-14-TSB1]|jgi:catecholate siderophore receptor|nr:TonB-dependent siderophore receptor [Sphingobium sp. GW456-12-10-14-TSB1]OUC53577.1 TonB-dependent siderophore receptor [Sphingobium sp. GW456-12-10-14-TSB1]QCI95272.1 TonB-dependent siderophore receptor [Novosphingobium sp. EMRT-2]
MRSSIFARTSFSALSTMLMAAAAMPAAAQTQDKPTELGGVTVTDTAINTPEAETSYKVSRSIGAMRTDTPLIDVPQSVTVVPVKQITDQAANNIGDAIRYVPGVFSAQGEGNRETLVLRGNSTTGDFFVDGIRDDVQTYRDLYNIEQLEVYKGPNAMIFGRGGVGGLVNRVTKVADWNPHRAFRLEGGSFEHKRAQFDLGAPLGESVAVRLTGVYQDSDSYRDGVNYNRWGFNPTVTFKLGEATTITAGYEHFEDDRVADRGVSSYLGRPLETRRGAFFGDPDNSPTWTDTDAANLYIEHRFSDTVSIRNRTRYADYDKFYRNVFAGAVNTAAVTNPTGLPAGVYAPGTIYSVAAYDNLTRRENLINQTDLNAQFNTGAIEHTLLIGAEFGRQETENVRNEGFFPTAANPLGVSSIFATIASPRVRRPDVLWRQTSTSGDNEGVTKIAAGYIQDQIALSPMFEVVVGVRFEHIKTDVTDRRTVGFPATQRRDLEATDNLWSPRAGLIFKPVENASIYAAFSRTYLPRGGDQLAGLSLTNEALDPEKYDNYEIGAKWDIVPTFNVSAAVFQLDRSNVLALSDPNNPASVTVPIGRQRTKGVELSAQGEITDQVSVIASYTYSDAKFLDSQSGTVLRGNRVPNVPKHAASLWTRFDPTETIGAAVGIIHQGRRFSATDNLVSMPSYTRLDGALYFKVAPELDVQLNVENLLNERYFLYAHSNTNHTPGSSRAFKVGLNAHF